MIAFPRDELLTFTPAGTRDCKARAKALSAVLGLRLAAGQELLARVYGHANAVALAAAASEVDRRTREPGPFMTFLMPSMGTRLLDETIKVVGKDMSAAAFALRDDAMLFGVPNACAAGLKRLKAANEAATPTRKVTSPRPMTDYAILRHSQGEASLGFTALGAGVFDASERVLRTFSNGGISYGRAMDKFRAIETRHPGCPWPIGMSLNAALLLEGYGPWTDVNGSTLPKEGSSPQDWDEDSYHRSQDLVEAAKLDMPLAIKAVEGFERYYGATTDFAPIKFMSDHGSMHGGDSYWYAHTLYCAGMVALEAGQEAVAKGYFQRLKVIDDNDSHGVRFYLDVIALNEGRKPRGRAETSAFDVVLRLCEAMRSGPTPAKEAALLAYLLHSSMAVRARHGAYRDCDAFRPHSNDASLCTMREPFHRLGPYLLRYPEVAETIDAALGDEGLREAHAAYHRKVDARFGWMTRDGGDPGLGTTVGELGDAVRTILVRLRERRPMMATRA